MSFILIHHISPQKMCTVQASFLSSSEIHAACIFLCLLILHNYIFWFNYPTAQVKIWNHTPFINIGSNVAWEAERPVMPSVMLHPGASSICIIIKSPLLDENNLHLTALNVLLKGDLFFLSSFEMSMAPPSLFQWPPVVGLCIMASGKAHFLSKSSLHQTLAAEPSCTHWISVTWTASVWFRVICFWFCCKRQL